MMKPIKQQGFTLIELMVTVAIMAIMAAIALPSMNNFIAKTRLVNRSEQIANMFRFAKGEAVRTGMPVIVCGVAIRSDGRPSGNCSANNIGQGLMAFADADRNGLYDSNTDTVLRTVSINGNGDTKVNIASNACGVTSTTCNTAIATQEFVFMPNGMFGYKMEANTTRANFLSKIELAKNYVRFTLSDSQNTNLSARYVVVAPGGTATTCLAGDPDAYKTETGSDGSISQRVCSAQ